jgi:peptide/nickel transport system ATP-binding protein
VGSELLRIEQLAVEFVAHGETVRAVDGVTLSLQESEIYGLVGETGCGKSALCLSVLGLLGTNGSVAEGRVIFQNKDLLHMSDRELRSVRGRDVGMIFQDPGASLNPIMKIGAQLVEAVRTHNRVTRRQARARAADLLTRVGIRDASQWLDQYPHQLSGGMQQRVMIAMAMLNRPKLLIADEPVTALDVSIQREILDLIEEMRVTSQTAVLLVTHDMGVVAETCDRVGVLYAGRLIEEGETQSIISSPMHPYTQGLLASVPKMGVEPSRLSTIAGSVGEARELVGGCRFRPRCPYKFDACETEDPLLAEGPDGRLVACHLYRPAEGSAHSCGMAS